MESVSVCQYFESLNVVVVAPNGGHLSAGASERGRISMKPASLASARNASGWSNFVLYEKKANLTTSPMPSLFYSKSGGPLWMWKKFCLRFCF